MYSKNILPNDAPIVYFGGEWMSHKDFEAYSGDKGAHRATMYIIFYNDTLKRRNDSWQRVYAVSYHNYRNCQIISQMIEVAHSPTIPTMEMIIEFSKNWATDITYGFLTDADDDQVYFIGEIKKFKALYEKIWKSKAGKIKNLKIHKGK